MVFNSYVFLLIFAPLVYGLYWLVLPHRQTIRLAFLVIASYLFYAYGSIGYVPILLLVSLLTWGVGVILERQHNRILLLGGIALVAAPLIVTKYGAFILKTFALPASEIALPIGISFYTFQAISYVVDVHTGRISAERSPLHVIAYLAFFPNLVAGPIVRYRHLGPYLQQLPNKVEEDRRAQGLILIIMGLAGKVLIADRIGESINPLLAEPGNLGFFAAWIVMIAYGLQLYYDFSGYSRIAIGLAAWFGIPIPANFNRPYIARNISEFWTRWHISLSTWLRDYIFFPLSRALLGKWGSSRSTLVMIVGHLITMTVAGAWHGVAWTFVLWGVFHGGLLIIFHLTRPLNLIRWRIVNWILTFAAVTLGWVLFRSPSLDIAATLYRSMAGLNGFESLPVLRSIVELKLIGFVGLALLIEFLVPADVEMRVRTRSAEAILFTALAVFTLLSMGVTQRFLYFQF